MLAQDLLQNSGSVFLAMVVQVPMAELAPTAASAGQLPLDGEHSASFSPLNLMLISFWQMTEEINSFGMLRPSLG